MRKIQSKTLGKNNWIDIGLKTLALEGIDAVRVERLAKKLNVTKGSFYWHFKDRNSLQTALLKAWVTRATNDIIHEVESRGGGPRKKLHALFDIVFNASGRLDLEIRAWAARDNIAQRAMAKVDDVRLKYIENLFSELGLTSAEATARSRFAYHALIGQFAMATQSAQNNLTPEQFKIIFKMLTHKK